MAGKNNRTSLDVRRPDNAGRGNNQGGNDTAIKSPGSHNTLIAVVELIPMRLIYTFLFYRLSSYCDDLFFETCLWRYAFLSFFLLVATLGELAFGACGLLTKMCLVSAIESIDVAGKEL